MDALRLWFNQLDFTVLWNLLRIALACLLCITLHEFAHGAVAYLLGDRTARQRGRLSLNPLRHMDLFGLILLAFAGFGWAKPVPINPRNFKHPKLGMALCAFAGPVANVLICIMAYLLAPLVFDLLAALHWGEASVHFTRFLVLCAQLSAGMAVFNLLPIPPLDGSKLLFALLPDKIYFALMRYERYGVVVLALLMMSGVLNGVLGATQQLLLRFSYEIMLIILF